MSGRARAGLRALAIAAVGLWVTSASAFPVLFGGSGGFGISASSASSAQTAGFSVIHGASIVPANDFDIVVPAPDVLSSHIVGSPSVSNPNTAMSRWSVTNGSDGNLSDAWLVFLTPLTYTPSKVGIDLQSGGQWAIFDASAGGTDYFYPAVFLGDLGAQDTNTFLMHHVVGQALTQQGQTLILPQYQIGIVTGIPLPEPSALLLIAAGVGLAAALRRGKV
ncbi:MAG TPA: hypothetical protein VMR50_22190 [Myxococcota bacterium]|nr:hypothetical protein [Myxococcota bacterium]